MSVTAAPAAEPKFVQASPFRVDLEPGKEYYYCACGLSKNQPFCDGSHRGTGITPIKFKVDEAKKYSLCGCKETASAPFCDGTHNKEKGVKKYNAYLLRANRELQEQLAEATKKSSRSIVNEFSIVGVSLGVVVGAFIASKYFKSV
ncbi:iron-binding zinc finger CDGSH type-domain-containing protein [Chytriomyces sp. MP71]|nr:iron-binding zinc finger CDGSH type-domain-containing protein [Chytriomyces sp. MP71]